MQMLPIPNPFEMIDGNMRGIQECMDKGEAI